MTTRTTLTLDFSTFPESDGEPMAETVENMIQMTDLIFVLRGLLASQGRTRVAVGGNQFLYYNERNGRDHVSPDVYVALDVPPGLRPTWKTWLEGKCPDVVFEITSPSTQDEDLGPKRALYARLGAREYYIYDPQLVLAPPLRAYQSYGGQMESRPLLPSGGIFSPLLGVELRPVDQYLRVIDLASGQPLPTAEEVRGSFERLRRDVEGMRRDFEGLRQDVGIAQRQLVQEVQARHAAEERATAAEERAARAEAALQALLDADPQGS